MDVAASIQAVTNEVMLRLARHAREVTGQKNLCLAGGVALNCVANGLILRENIFERIWIQPAAGDAGGALGAALVVAADANRRALSGRPPTLGTATRRFTSVTAVRAGDKMRGALLGPESSEGEIKTVLDRHKASYQRLDQKALLDRTVELLQQEKVIGWVQGRMEFGPRALGSRSILGDPRSPQMQSVMNLKVKFRESFRPFAPVVRRERLSDYFELEADSPYMLLVAPVKECLRLPLVGTAAGLQRLRQSRSTISAVTHVDYSARIQTVTRDENPLLYALLQKFEQATGCGVLVNTSFNVRGEPIICTPDDAYRCFVNTEMDYLVIGNFLLERTAQPGKPVARTFEPIPD
jgi:carbamoyltransferase